MIIQDNMIKNTMIRYKRVNICLLFIFYFFTQSLILFAQKNDSVPVNDSILFSLDFFDKEEVIEITLEFDIKKFTTEKSDEDYLPTILTYYINDTVEIRESVKIKARGEFRRDYCYFPPFMLNVKKTDLYDDVFSEAYKIKVVSHCKNSKAYSNCLIKEYFGYKIFNIITDYSFKVRFINVRYIDIGRKNKITTNWAFMIEPEAMLAERLEAYPLKMNKINYRQADTLTTTIMSIFQYMIGNTDYSITGRHNVKLLTLKDHTKPALIPIPYDFDYSGMVYSEYAEPQSNVGIESVTDRCFYGMCRTDDVYNYVLELYREKKDEIFLFVNSFEYVDNKTRKYVIKYLEEFYKEIDKPNFIKNRLRITCEKWCIL